MSNTLEVVWFNLDSLIDDIVERFRDSFKGLIVHHPDPRQSCHVACTLPGLQGLLPLKPDVAEKLTAQYSDPCPQPQGTGP